MSNTELAQVKEESREISHMKISRLDDSLFSKDLAPHYMKLAGQLANSEMVPKCFRGKPSDLFLCWAMGYQIGIPPEQAMNCIMILNGKAVMWGDEMLALCMSHPDFIDIIEDPIVGAAGSVTGYTCTLSRKNRTNTVSVFTLDMAKKAGLLAKGGVWNQYPERMLKLRARGFALRDAFPDALKGIKSREEVEDYIDADYIVHDKKGSRTEQLKQELINADIIQGQDLPVENRAPREETSAVEESGQEDEPREEKAEVHSEIRRLIEEKHFPQERLDKALKYYEVENIEDLTIETGIDFINQLVKL